MAVPVPRLPADWELTPAPEDADPFRYGWRPRYVHLPVWGIPGLEEPAPDVAVIRGVRDKAEVRDTFNVPLEGVRPCLIIEVVSPKYEEIRDNDYVEKKRIYEQAEIPEYLIVEQYRVRESPLRQWTGYRLGFDGRYQTIEPDGEGRLLSQTTGLLFGIAKGGGFQVTNAWTGEVLLNQGQLSSAWKEAEERAAQEAKARAAAEQRAAQEAEARKAAEAEIARLRTELERKL